MSRHPSPLVRALFSYCFWNLEFIEFETLPLFSEFPKWFTLRRTFKFASDVADVKVIGAAVNAENIAVLNLGLPFDAQFCDYPGMVGTWVLCNRIRQFVLYNPRNL